MRKIKLSVIGLGRRCTKILDHVLLPMEDVEICAVCDLSQERIDVVTKMICDRKGKMPFGTTDYEAILHRPEIDAVYISTGWEAHVELAIAAMRAGKYVGVEVGGAYAIEDCRRLVRAHESTGTHCMFMENCCYSRTEMMCQNMAEHGVLGKIVHCEGGYRHDLRTEIAGGSEADAYRLQNYMKRNCDNYPTHQLGPICKLLHINRGNRLLSLVSVASKSEGLREYLKEKGDHSSNSKARFAQSDIVTTLIRCAGGETIRLSLDTTLPRPYSRGFVVCGTKGYYEESSHSVYLEKDKDMYEGDELHWKRMWGNAEEYAKRYDHPAWKGVMEKDPSKSGVIMNTLLFRAFLESVAANVSPPIDVYDAATWMSISVLSEQSIAMGGRPVAIPDFTGGKWILGVE